MVNDNQRDQAMERLLRQSAAGLHAASPVGPCLDGETLASWTANALSPAQAAQVEVHLADCRRCQAMVAALVRTEPVVTPSAGWRQRWQVRWLVPVATAATVAAIWIAIPDRDVSLPETVTPESDVRLSSPQASATAPSAGDRSAENTVPQLNAAPRPLRTAPATPVEQKSRAEKREEVSRDAVGRQAARQAPAAASTPPPPSSAPRLPVTAPAATIAAAEAPPTSGVPATASQERRGAVAVVPSDTVELRSADGVVRWRIVGGRRVERAVAGGQQWEVALSSPVLLTAGHALSATVAWLVGPRGAIYVTPDGSRFERVPFAEAADLVSIVAVSDRDAIAAAADGRRFRTTDRGLTWKLQ